MWTLTSPDRLIFETVLQQERFTCYTLCIIHTFAKYITYGPTNGLVYELGLMEDARARAMPSHPDNAKHQLTLSQAWYAKWRTYAAEMYTEMMTE